MQDFDWITIKFSPKCHVFRVTSPGCKTFFFFANDIYPIVCRHSVTSWADKTRFLHVAMPHTSQKTFKNSANTAEIRTPFGVNYDSSKRKVRVLHFSNQAYYRYLTHNKSRFLYLKHYSCASIPERRALYRLRRLIVFWASMPYSETEIDWLLKPWQCLA